MFFNSFMLENKRNIKVVSIKPGVIATPLWGKSITYVVGFGNTILCFQHRQIPEGECTILGTVERITSLWNSLNL